MSDPTTFNVPLTPHLDPRQPVLREGGTSEVIPQVVQGVPWWMRR